MKLQPGKIDYLLNVKEWMQTWIVYDDDNVDTEDEIDIETVIETRSTCQQYEKVESMRLPPER